MQDFLFLRFILLFLCVWCILVPATDMSAPAYKGQKKASDPLEMALTGNSESLDLGAGN